MLENLWLSKYPFAILIYLAIFTHRERRNHWATFIISLSTARRWLAINFLQSFVTLYSFLQPKAGHLITAPTIQTLDSQHTGVPRKRTMFHKTSCNVKRSGLLLHPSVLHQWRQWRGRKMKNGTSKLECGGPLLLRVHKRRSWRKPLLDTLRPTASGGADHTMRVGWLVQSSGTFW